MDPIALLEKYHDKDSEEFKILLEHSKAVAKKAVEIAKKVGADVEFVREAALLHDIGVTGEGKYILHGIKGKEILEKEGLPKHALVCERHIGVGLTKEDVEKQNLPLPKKDMIPLTIEEEIVAYADLFHSKSNGFRDVEEIKKRLSKYGEENVKKFEEWHSKFS